MRQISEVPGINSSNNNAAVNNPNALITNMTLMRGRFESNSELNGFMMNMNATASAATISRDFISSQSATPVQQTITP